MRVQSNGKIRRTEDEWKKILRRYRQSGLSDAAFCRREKISKYTFAKWKRAVAEDAAAGTTLRFVDLTPTLPPPSSPLAPDCAERPLGEFELALPGGVVLRWKA